ncbi:hypothetical protein EVAR_3881_1 [Eumeta japonica]|uniref:PiggyBac transposable element-derived protein domain-containing protein n=1 Tax=Eumeta variegata TaxID=151549 RepID=A0A4C1SR90_EUMVA|nr:hypothetical protein EVAR_3881_1 [Eumeta japonica]
MVTRSLNDEILTTLQMQKGGEEYIDGNYSDLEPDEIIKDFRELSSSNSWNSDDDEPLSNLKTSMQHLLRVKEVPTRQSYKSDRKNEDIDVGPGNIRPSFIQGDQTNTATLPEMVDFCYKTKEGADTFDRLCHRYSVSRKTRRWPLCLFFGLLNAVGVNFMTLPTFSTAIYKETFPNRRGFLKTLALNLITPWLEVRSNWPTLHSNVQQIINAILKEIMSLDSPTPVLPNQGRCADTGSSSGRKGAVNIKRFSHKSGRQPHPPHIPRLTASVSESFGGPHPLHKPTPTALSPLSLHQISCYDDDKPNARYYGMLRSDGRRGGRMERVGRGEVEEKSLIAECATRTRADA